jgi:predicted membrane protein
VLDSFFLPVYTSTDQITALVYLVCSLASLALGAVIAFAAGFRSRQSKSFMLALLLIPVIVQMVIMLVNDNVGAGVAVMGAFSLVRFRSAPGSAKEIVSIFLAMATGLATAKGYIALAAVFVIVISLIMIISTYVRFKEKDDLVRELKITIPEDLNYAHEFDDLFDTYTKRSKLLNVKTTNMGSLYKLSYEVELKSEDNVQSFIDDLRTRNGNLEIAVLLPAVSEGVL